MNQSTMTAKVWDEIANHYGHQIISPMLHSVSNPLMKCLKKMPQKKLKHVADFGCGNGNLLPYLAARFKQVSAIDFSSAMLEHSKQRLQNLNLKQQNKVQLYQVELHQFSRFKIKLDVAIAVNSILQTNPLELQKIFHGLFLNLKKKGEFLGVFPALESVQEEYHYTYLKELKKYNNTALAQKATNKKLQIDRVDFKLGTYFTDDMLQKYYTRYELNKYLATCGFKKIIFDRVVYKQGHSYNYVDQNLTGHPAMWDWFVCAKK